VPSISLITYCKGRRPEAEQYVPAALAALSELDELVFVDYDDPGGSGPWVVSLADPRVTVVRVSDMTYFHANHARNLGGLAAVGDIVIFSDVDFLISPELIRECRAVPLRSYLVQPDNVGSWGFVVCLRSDFAELQGWDEAFVGYGCDDLHFRSALDALGRTCYRMSARLVGVSRSGEQVRMHEVSQNISAAFNSRLSRALRMMHRYKMNLSRNWGKGGKFLCRSTIGGQIHGAASDAKSRGGCDGPGKARVDAAAGRLCT
jgi:hypothetical protein